MKVPHVIAELVSEFSGFQHTPDFKASRSTGNFEEESEEGTSSLSTPHHPESHSEHHGHSLYFGKHFGKKHNHHLPPVAEKDADTHSNHSEHSGCSSNTGSGSGHKHKHHGLTVHFKDFFHIGHHHKNHEHHQNEDEHHSKANSGASTPARKNSTGSINQCPCHKHSINITVGADEVPTVLATPPNEINSQFMPHFVKNPQSPCISRVVSSSSLKEKLNKIKRTTSSDSEADFPEKKCSVASYRVVTH